MTINYDKIQNDVRALGSQTDNTSFLEGFLSAFEFPKSTFARLSLGLERGVNQGIFVQDKIFFLTTTASNVFSEFNILKKNKNLGKLNADFIIVANETDLIAYERNSERELKTEKVNLYRHIEFFFSLLGLPATAVDEIKSADMKAAEKFAELYNKLMIINPNSNDDISELICRLLLCCFADSIGVLTNNGLRNIMSNYTADSGVDLDSFMSNLFFAMKSLKRDGLPGYFADVKFIDTRLFESKIAALSYNRETRNLMVELLGLNWSDISPEMLGGLIQSIIRPSDNDASGNYTSTANIQKVIGPLFMNDIYQAYETAEENIESYQSLLARIHKISIFDPSCGAGNFLLVTYKELSKLARRIFEKLNIQIMSPSIPTSNFYGIDSNHFSCAIARLGFLFIVCQERRDNNSNIATFFPEAINILFSGNIVTANATRIDWESVCSGDGETYVIGNPSYSGGNRKTSSQKLDIAHVFAGYQSCANLDYAACWFMLATKYISTHKGGFAFVTTNSLTQGEQVQMLWPKLFEKGVHIRFAYRPFKWKNDARNRTMVTVVIIGVVPNSNSQRRELFTSTTVFEPRSISPYLVPGTAVVERKSSPISALPEMVKGNMPYDNGNLLLNNDEMTAIISSDPQARNFIKKIVGAREFIQGNERWCLWIRDIDFDKAMSIPAIKKRVDKVRDYRLANKDSSVKKLARRPHQFREMHETLHAQSLVVPAVSSENYMYIPIGFIDKNTVVSNLVSIVYDCEPWVFGIITSQMHNVWAKTFCGKHEERPRYSLELGYNTFPFPDITQEQKNRIYRCVLGVIGVREQHTPKTLAQLYKSGQMPDDLIGAHSLLDKVVESCYKDTPFVSDQDRLECLLELYDSMGGQKE